MSRAFGQTNLKSVSLATGLGAASSSCSYAAVAAARSAIQQGAALLPALAFMFASTNLVIELGAVLWVLMGWQFVLAEILGAFMLIIIMWLMIQWFLPKTLETEIRSRAQGNVQGANHCHHPASPGSGLAGRHQIVTATPFAGGHEGGKWTGVAHAFVLDWSMLWKEILGGFLIAGFIVDLIFNALGLIPQGPRPPSAVEHAHIIWNYTSMLDVTAAIFTAWLLFLYFKSRDQDSARACD